MSILGSICNLPFSGHHDLYDIISSWKVEQNQAVKTTTQGKASPAKNQTPGKEPIYGQRKPAGARTITLPASTSACVVTPSTPPK